MKNLFNQRNFSTLKNETLNILKKQIFDLNPNNFSKKDFNKIYSALSDKTLESVNKNDFPFFSDTGSSTDKLVFRKFILDNAFLKATGDTKKIIKEEQESIKTLFLKEEESEMMKDILIFNTSSTTQANKVTIMAGGNINPIIGEIALASEHSHIFHFEVGQPAEKVTPQDKKTGKLTIEDLEKSINYYENDLRKKVKILHLDQPTKGDYFYTKDELKTITNWAHKKGIPVSMDAERLVNQLSIKGYDSYYEYTRECGIDIVTVGMQKNGGARSSATIVLNKEYISDAKNLEDRVASFLKTMGGVTNNFTSILSGWNEMIETKQYLRNASKANEYANQIADAIVNFKFQNKELEIQNYPLTTNMIFAKFPEEFVTTFNDLAKIYPETSHLKLSPDRAGTTRIVTAFDTKKDEVDQLISLLQKTYKIYKKELNEDIQENQKQPIERENKISEQLSISEEESLKAKKEGPIDEIVDVIKKIPNEIKEEEIKEVLELIIDKVVKSIEVKNPEISGKITNDEAPIDSSIIAGMFIENSKSYHPPYGDDEVTRESEECIRELFGKSSTNSPVVFTSSKAQAINVGMQFLEITRNSAVIVSEGSHPEHSAFNRNVKAVELQGDYKKFDKLDPKSVNALLGFHNSNRGKHVPLLTAVFIQQPTSKGYVYTPEEIKELVLVAHNHDVPVVMDMSGLSYHLAKTGENYKKYSTDCGVDACTIGLSGLGGGKSSAIVILNSKHLALESQNVETILNRTVKENGGKQSGSSALVGGWKEITENELWRNNANKVNKIIDIMIPEFKNLGMEIENNKPGNNIIHAKIPDKAIKFLEEKGYEFKKNREGFARIKIHYNLKESEAKNIISDFKEAYKELNKQPSNSLIPKEEKQLKSEINVNKLI